MSQLSAGLFPLKKKSFFLVAVVVFLLALALLLPLRCRQKRVESKQKKKELTFRLSKPSTLYMAFSHDGCRENCRAYPCNVACSFVTASSQVSPKPFIRKEEKKQSGWGKDKKKTSCLLHYTDKHLAVLFPTLYQSQFCNR